MLKNNLIKSKNDGALLDGDKVLIKINHYDDSGNCIYCERATGVFRGVYNNKHDDSLYLIQRAKLHDGAGLLKAGCRGLVNLWVYQKENIIKI